MANNPSSVTVQPSQQSPMQSAQALGGRDHYVWSNEHLLGINPAGPYPALNYVSALPPTRYTSRMGYDDPPHLVIGSVEQGRGSQRQIDSHRTPGMTQSIPIPPGPPRFEQYAPTIPEAPHPPIHVPPHNIAGPSQENLTQYHSMAHPGTLVGEDLKNLASRYLHSPGSHVDKLRMRRSRSGTVKVLILLEIDDIM